MVVYREAHGRPLDRVDPAAVADAARGTARWLHRLHRSRTVLPRRLDLRGETAGVRGWAASIADHQPDSARAAYDLAERLCALTGELPAVSPVPIHKDLHPGHVLVCQEGITVIDLDEARMGDPALDVAHLCAYVEASSWPAAAIAARTFLDEYGAVPGPSAPERLGFFRAYTQLKIAKQLAMGSGPRSITAGRDRTASLRIALDRGLACLGG